MEPIWNYAQSLTSEESEKIIRASNINPRDRFVPPIKYGLVLKVIDGDTIKIASVIFPNVVSVFNVRLKRIDAPELTSKKKWQKQAAHYIKDKLQDMLQDKMVELEDVTLDKYGRVLAEVKFGEINVSTWLLKSGFAINYKSKKRIGKINWRKKVTDARAADRAASQPSPEENDIQFDFAA